MTKEINTIKANTMVLEVLCSKNIIRNFIPMVKMFWLSETEDYFETDYH
jgi:hypothetical protein